MTERPLVDPERPEPEFSWGERRADRKRLRAVRGERRRQMARDSKDRKSLAKDRKKGKKGK